MSTRAYVAIQKLDHYDFIYCHFDGYIDHLGLMLAKYYSKQEQAEELISMGDASFIGQTLDNSETGSTFYYRDKDEELVIGRALTIDEIASKNDIKYVYKDDNQWYMIHDDIEINLKKYFAKEIDDIKDDDPVKDQEHEEDEDQNNILTIEYIIELASFLRKYNMTMSATHLIEHLNHNDFTTSRGTKYQIDGRGKFSLISKAWHKLNDAGLEQLAENVAKAFTDDQGNYVWM